MRSLGLNVVKHDLGTRGGMMSLMRSGPDAMRLIRNMRYLHQEIAVLLQEIEGLAEVQGYTNRSGARVVDILSTSIDCPELWMPYYNYLMVEKKSSRAHVVVFNVVVDQYLKHRRIKEPMLLGLRMAFTKRGAKKYLHPWRPMQFWFEGDAKVPGRLYSHFFARWDNEREFLAEVRTLRLLGVPLSSVRHSRDLEAFIRRLF